MNRLSMLIAALLPLAGCCTTTPPDTPPTSPIPASKVAPVKALSVLDTGNLKEMSAQHLRHMETFRQLVIDREAVRRMLEARGLLAGDSDDHQTDDEKAVK